MVGGGLLAVFARDAVDHLGVAAIACWLTVRGLVRIDHGGAGPQ